MRGLRAAVLAAAVLAMVGAGCGGDDDGGGGGFKPPDGGIEIKPGRWYIQASATSSDPSCASLAAFVASEDSVTICGKADPDDFLEGLACDFSVSGNSVTVGCNGSVNYLGCEITYQGQGTGTFNTERSLFTLAIPITLSATDVATCGGTLNCTLTISLVARWAHDGGCTSTAPFLEDAMPALLAPLGGLGLERGAP